MRGELPFYEGFSSSLPLSYRDSIQFILIPVLAYFLKPTKDGYPNLVIPTPSLSALYLLFWLRQLPKHIDEIQLPPNWRIHVWLLLSSSILPRKTEVSLSVVFIVILLEVLPEILLGVSLCCCAYTSPKRIH